jgi:hypothetical protein
VASAAPLYTFYVDSFPPTKMPTQLPKTLPKHPVVAKHLFHLLVTTAFAGRVQDGPVDGVQVSLRFTSIEQLFPKRLQTDLILMLDGKRVSVTIDEWLKKSEREDGWTSYVEEARFLVMQPLLSDMLLAGEIRGKLVNETMELTEVMHKALGALVQIVKFKDAGTTE